MSITALRKSIQEQLASGRLPKDAPRQLLASYGDGGHCDVCGLATETSTVRYAMRLGTGAQARSWVMHCVCFDLWEGERKSPPETTVL